jgi:hypothetical protein
MPALRVQMHFHGCPSLLQCNVVRQRVVYVVHVVILRLQQKRRRRLASDRNIGIQSKLFIGDRLMRRLSNHKLSGALVSIPFRRGKREMARINGHRKIRAAAFFVGGIYSRVQTLIKVRANSCRQMPAGRKPKQPDLARHARKCTICHHKDRPVIDFDYLNWRSIQQIVKEYALPHRVALYRHADATGLTALRKSRLCSVLDSIIEQAETVQVTGATILRAMRAYSCLTKNGDWVDLPRRVTVRRSQQSASPASSVRQQKSNRYTAIRKSAKPLKTNA